MIYLSWEEYTGSGIEAENVIVSNKVAIYRTSISLFPTTGEFYVVLFASAVEPFPITTIFVPDFVLSF